MNNSIDIENNKLIFGDNNISIISAHEDIWFKGNDVAKALQYVRPRKAIYDHVDEKCKTTYLDLKLKHNLKLKNINSNTLYINEYGVHSLLGKRKECQFKNWIINEVLPMLKNDQNEVENDLFREVIQQNKVEQKFGVLESMENDENEHCKIYKCVNTKHRFFDKAEDKAADGFRLSYNTWIYLSKKSVMNEIEKRLNEKGVKYSFEKKTNIITIWGDFDFISEVDAIIEEINYL